MKVPKEISNLLSDKYVLYIVAFLSLTNVIAYLVAQDYNSLLFFAILGYLASYFSKNMTVILLCALIITNLLMTAKSLQNQTIRKIQREGLDNMDGVVSSSTKKPDGVDDDDDDETAKDAAATTATATAPPALATPALTTPAPAPKKEGMQPGIPGGIVKSMENMSPNKIKEMTQEAGALLESQQVLAENLKTMGPLLNTAKEMMDTLSGSEGMLNKLGMMGGLM
jgi:hypothetical protein